LLNESKIRRRKQPLGDPLEFLHDSVSGALRVCIRVEPSPQSLHLVATIFCYRVVQTCEQFSNRLAIYLLASERRAQGWLPDASLISREITFILQSYQKGNFTLAEAGGFTVCP